VKIFFSFIVVEARIDARQSMLEARYTKSYFSYEYHASGFELRYLPTLPTGRQAVRQASFDTVKPISS
jgi:hypothetical protein